MILNHRIHVLTRKEELEPARAAGRVAVVLDILFATSSMVNALAHGAGAIVPVPDEATARAEAAARPSGSTRLAGELDAVTLPGFAPPTPIALANSDIAGRTGVHSTTNGTVAFGLASGASAVYAGALLNGGALVDHLLRAHADDPLLIVCAGSMGNFNLEDFVGAGYLVDLLAKHLGERADFSDAALAARAVFRRDTPEALLLDSRVGRMFAARRLEEEVRYCARLSILPVVAKMEDGELRNIASR